MSASRTSHAIMCFISIVIVVDVVVGLLLVDLSRVEVRGCYMYRGDAAQIFIDKYGLKLKSQSLTINIW